MNINNEEKRSIIIELQKLAENVLRLKEEHRQKRPIIIEFSGSPKAGKTSCINSLELFLKRNGFSVKIVQERANMCPVSDKQSPMFNIWTSCMSLSGLIGILEDKNSNVDVLILDRGIFDSLCWFDWLVSNGKMEEKQRVAMENFLLMDELIKCIDIVFAFCVEPEISINREYTTLLTDKLGSIMNEKVLNEYLHSVNQMIDSKKAYFHEVFKIDTSNKNQDEVGKEVTEITLNTLKNLLMERVGYFELDNTLKSILYTNNVFEYKELKSVLPELKFDLRDKVESNQNFLQPIPIAIIVDKSKTKILVIKKNKKAVTDDSPEKDKLLLYVGGHSRNEDATVVNSNDFVSVCRISLKREIKEEIGISIALDNIDPFFIYTPTSEKSQKHLAVCFFTSIDEDSVKLRLDTQELVQNKGRSKSGKFIPIIECEQNELEEWGITILKRCFDTDVDTWGQLNLFN